MFGPHWYPFWVVEFTTDQMRCSHVHFAVLFFLCLSVPRAVVLSVAARAASCGGEKVSLVTAEGTRLQ